MQQQRRNELPLVQHLQHADRIQHGRRVWIGELFDERLDGCRIADVDTDRVDLECARTETLAERVEVLPPGDQRGRDPQHHDANARVTQTTPVEPQSPWLNQHKDDDRRRTLRKPVHRHIDERLRPVLQLGRQREEQHFARRLVDRVPKRGIEDPRRLRRPERAGQQDEHRHRTERHRQQHQGKRQAE